MIRKITHNYPKIFEGLFGQIRDNIIIEASWLGSFESFNKGKVIPIRKQSTPYMHPKKVYDEL